MAGCGSKKMAKGGMVKKAKGGMMISPRKAMAMGKKSSGDKKGVQKFAAGGSVMGGIRAPTSRPLPGANPRIPGPLPGANPRIPGPLPGANPRIPGPQTGGPLPLPNEQNLLFPTSMQANRVNRVRPQITRRFKNGGAVKKGK